MDQSGDDRRCANPTANSVETVLAVPSQLLSFGIQAPLGSAGDHERNGLRFDDAGAITYPQCLVRPVPRQAERLALVACFRRQTRLLD